LQASANRPVFFGRGGLGYHVCTDSAKGLTLERDGDPVAGTEQTLDWVDAWGPERRIRQITDQGLSAFFVYAR
jgi:hypothetical protein